MKMLVTGSQTWVDELIIEAAMLGESFIRTTLHPITAPLPPREITVVHGACPDGADKIADRFAMKLGWKIERYPAEWSRHGRAAGQIRNERMVKMGADVCLAFIRDNSPGSSKTLFKARREGIRTVVWRHDGKKIYLDTSPADTHVSPDQGELF